MESTKFNVWSLSGARNVLFYISSGEPRTFLTEMQGSVSRRENRIIEFQVAQLSLSEHKLKEKNEELGRLVWMLLQ